MFFQNLGLISLYKVKLQHNHIGTIDLHAFSGVTELRILDLSFNHLYYLLPATFEDTPQLRSLYLQGNRLKINPGPILIIPSLQVGYISLSMHIYKIIILPFILYGCNLLH
jgi:Leucine-rich repeat (LRR) protein